MNAEELQYASLLRALFGMVNTKNYTYGELADEIGINCGGFTFGVGSYDSCEDFNLFTGVFELISKAKINKLDFVFDMYKEVIMTSDLTDKKRIREVLGQMASRMQSTKVSSGHVTAIGRAAAAFSHSAKFSELISGLEFARFVTRLEENFDEMADEIVEKLQAVRSRIFLPSKMLVSYTADGEGYKVLPALLSDFSEAFAEAFHDTEAPSSAFGKGGCRYDLETGRVPYVQSEGLTASSQVQYVARTGNFAAEGLPYKASLRILNVILNYDYMWINVRVKGGAYGCMSGFARNGESYLVSYRDPNLKETNDVYEGIPEYLRSFDADERDMTKYIIGTISDLDVPQTPKMKGTRSMSAYLIGLTEEMMQKQRDEILSCQVEDIRALADYIETMLKNSTICVVGGENKIQENSGMFDRIESMFPKKTEGNM